MVPKHLNFNMDLIIYEDFTVIAEFSMRITPQSSNFIY